MKKSNIISFVLGAIVFGSISAVSAYAFFASDISYTPEDTSWNVDNVKSALDDLHDKAVFTTLLWKNPDDTVDFPDQTLELDLSKFNYVLIETKRYKGDGVNGYNGQVGNQFSYIKIGESGTIMGIDNNYAYHYVRDVTVNEDGITFGKAYQRAYNLSCGSGYIDDAIPVKIYGIKYK